MKVTKAFRFRIYPTEEQKHILTIQFGHTRFVYNHFLTVRKDYYFANKKGLSRYDTQAMLTEMKANHEFEWLKQADSQALQFALKNLDDAYTRYFEMVKTGTLPPKGKKPRKDGMPKGYPAYHSKYDAQSINYPQRFEIKGATIYLPKVGWVKAIFHRQIQGEMKNCTVTRAKSGKYFISIRCLIEDAPEPVYEGKKTAGIDVGISNFAIISKHGEITKVDNPKWLRRSEKKLKQLQRKLSRQVRDSGGYDKTKHRIALLYESIANQRKDFQHKLAYDLVNECGFITIENLNIKGMMKNHRLAKAIGEVAWYQFSQFLDYKGNWYGSYLNKADRYFASSKTCYTCGHKIDTLNLRIREWVCPNCGTTLDRDGNAAINLEFYPAIAGVLNGTAGHKYAGGGHIADGLLVAPMQRPVKPEEAQR